MASLEVDTETQDTTGVGSSPNLGESSLEPENRSINSVNQAFSVCETLQSDWKKGISIAARITAKINGEKPYNQAALKKALKDWKSNVSTGFLSTECRKIQPRLHMPIKTAKYLTAATLPDSWANGAEKSNYFRQCLTDTIRGWTKFNFYTRGLAREVGVFGFGFNAWFDEWEWRPTLLRMDKGFLPQGTEVMDQEPQFFMAKYDYAPNELLSLLKANSEAGREEWKKKNVVEAINNAVPPPVSAQYQELRSFEDLIRQATWGWRYEKGVRLIRTYHLFAKEVTGKVSHYVVLADGVTSGGAVVSAQNVKSSFGDARLLYENLDQFESMQDVVNTMVFDFGDGTVHGSWGAGQILYDLAAAVEKIRCDSIDNLRMTNKMKIQVENAKNITDVQLTVNDTLMIVSGGQFAGNAAAMSQDVAGYEALDQKLTQIAQQKIGAFVPPIPMQPSDIKAAQINAALSKEKELQEDVLENWLIQFAIVVRTIARRLCKDGSPDEVAQELQKKLLTKLTREEIDLLANQFPVKSVIDFTEYRAQQRAMFATSVKGDNLFQQAFVARTMAEGVGDETFVKNICVPDGDQTEVLAAQRQQLMENAALALGQQVPVLPRDNDWVHMQTMKPGLQQATQSGNTHLAELGLNHYASHYAQGVAKKVIPDESINPEKSYISSMEDMINVLKEKETIQKAGQQAQQQATAQAQQMVQQGMA